MQLVYGFFENRHAQHASGSAEASQATRALGTPQIAGGCRFNRKRNGSAPMDGFFCDFRNVITANNL